MEFIKEFNEYLNDNFKKWFGNSKVVDSQGKPLIVYHGTTKNFGDFDLEKQDKFGDFGLGFYFTEEKNIANFYTIRKETASIMSVYLSIQNPFIIELYNEKLIDISIYNNLKFPTEYELDIKQILDDNDYFTYKKINKLIGDNVFTHILKQSGFDGVFVNRTFTFNNGTGNVDELTKNHEIVAFSPKQIKSATGNNGIFNVNSKNINESNDKEL